jgi:hypothetical protein
MRSVFEFEDYKQYLLARLRGFDGRGAQSAVAGALRCKPSFLSKVLHRKTHLTPDHAVALAEYWGMQAREAEYFRELVQLGRAGTPLLRAVIQRRLSDLKPESPQAAQ